MYTVIHPVSALYPEDTPSGQAVLRRAAGTLTGVRGR